jgi:hypothetical protein
MVAPESVPGASINDRRLYIGNLSWNFDSEGKLKQFLDGRGRRVMWHLVHGA